MNLKKVTIASILSLSFLFVACTESTLTPSNEGAESEIEEAGEDAGEAVEDAEDSVTEGVGEAGSAIEEAGDAVEDATN